MREDQIIETEDDMIDLGAASEVTLGLPKPEEFEVATGIDHRAKVG